MKYIDNAIWTCVAAALVGVAMWMYQYSSHMDAAAEMELARQASWESCDKPGVNGKPFIGPDGLPWCTVYEWNESK